LTKDYLLRNQNGNPVSDGFLKNYCDKLTSIFLDILFKKQRPLSVFAAETYG